MKRITEILNKTRKLKMPRRKRSVSETFSDLYDDDSSGELSFAEFAEELCESNRY